VLLRSTPTEVTAASAARDGAERKTVTDLLTIIGAELAQIFALLPLEAVRPSRGNGFAGSIIGALMAIGLLVIVAKFATTRPRRRRPPKA
jgi:hypothetical protein